MRKTIDLFFYSFTVQILWDQKTRSSWIENVVHQFKLVNYVLEAQFHVSLFIKSGPCIYYDLIYTLLKKCQHLLDSFLGETFNRFLQYDFCLKGTFVQIRDKSYRDRLSAKICDIFHSIFYCLRDQSANICILGYLRILWIRNTKSSIKGWIHKCYVSCLKLEFFFNSCKTNPWMGIMFNKCPWDGTLKTYRKNVACRAGST